MVGNKTIVSLFWTFENKNILLQINLLQFIIYIHSWYYNRVYVFIDHIAYILWGTCCSTLIVIFINIKIKLFLKLIKYCRKNCNQHIDLSFTRHTTPLNIAIAQTIINIKCLISDRLGTSFHVESSLPTGKCFVRIRISNHQLNNIQTLIRTKQKPWFIDTPSKSKYLSETLFRNKRAQKHYQRGSVKAYLQTHISWDCCLNDTNI